MEFPYSTKHPPESIAWGQPPTEPVLAMHSTGTPSEPVIGSGAWLICEGAGGLRRSVFAP